ncbi:OB-fold domain-containing protein [Corynebacterium crudilactis]|uniref:ChsH2 C-terminal OB-fold domain-containing protein n=1 Tax=Corynebacterium crudilactis TaxID=1652495 RepID=A0A172QSU2_9CORY|nr:OB-fold domain-containing protein [Corynebacterium crudilactis]ANE03742.1 hypothetical protein ccrud_05635 [Corynebacterium crudilactis]
MTAEILTYTIIRTPPAGFDGAPYCVAVIDNNGTAETARVAGYVDGQDVHIGDTVRALEEPDQFGATFRFEI